MRMWNVDPATLCRKHLLGEHVETHMFVGTIARGISLQGYFKNGLVTPRTLKNRHDELAAEMTRRGYNHKSPMSQPEWCGPDGMVDSRSNLEELARRCSDCAERQGG